MECHSLCFLLLIAVLYTCSFCAATAVRNCNPDPDSIANLKLGGCVDDSADICELKRGTNSSGTFHFKLAKPTSMITAMSFGVMGKLEQAFPLEYPNLCDDPNGGLKCPLEPNVENSYTIIVPILKTYPRIKCDIRWEFKNDAGEMIMCMVVPVKIVRADDE